MSRIDSDAQQSNRGIEGPAAWFIFLAVVVIATFGPLALLQRESAIDRHQAQRAERRDARRHAASVAAALEASERRIQELAAQPSPTPFPSAPPGTYRVQVGDSLFSVAADLGISVGELVYWNQEQYATLAIGSPALEPGWLLAISGPALPAPSPTQVPPSVAAGPIHVAINGASILYQAVVGSSMTELLRSSHEAVADECESRDLRAVACADVVFWDFVPITSTSGNTCTVSSVDIKYQLEVVFPLWTPPSGSSPDLVQAWRQTADNIAAHEQRHIDVWLQGFEEIRQMAQGADCSAFDGLLDFVLDDLRLRQDRIDGG